MAGRVNNDTSSSLRVLTLNTHLLTPIFQKHFSAGFPYSSGPSCEPEPDIKDKNTLIVEQLLKDVNDYDVIVFLEVWSDYSKDYLVNELSKKYPYYIKKVWGCSPTKVCAEADIIPGIRGCTVIHSCSGKQHNIICPTLDSGMMIFSRYPFENLPGRGYGRNYWFEGSPGTSKDHIAFTEFAGTDIDSFASKGAAAVRVHNPQDLPNRHYNIVFTHTQEEGYDVKKNQLKQIHQLILDTFGAASLTNPQTEVLLVMGDMNINGNFSQTGYCNDPKNPAANDQEYCKIANDPDPDLQFFKNPLYDTWPWTTSPQDFGGTSVTSDARYDYIFHNRSGWPHQDLDHEIDCVQHITRLPYFSDHLGLFADINRPVPFCNPRTALPITEVQTDWYILANLADLLPEEGADATGAGIGMPLDNLNTLWYPGAMQWVRIDQAGTYTISLPDEFFADLPSGKAKFSLELYNKEDLSHPIATIKPEKHIEPRSKGEDPRMVLTYRMPNPPFYIRVRSEDRRHGSQAVGHYYFHIHRHSCLKKEDACDLGQNEEPIDIPQYDPNHSFGSSNTFWYSGKMSVALSGSRGQQTMSFNALNDDNKEARLELLNADETPILAEPSAAGDWSTAQKIEIPYSELGNHPFYLRLTLLDPTQTQFKVGWTTNLNFITGYAIAGARPGGMETFVETQDDDVGSDEGRIFIVLDDMTQWDEGAASLILKYEDKENKSQIPMEDAARHTEYDNLPALGFVKWADYYVVEEDDSSMNDTLWFFIDPLPPAIYPSPPDLTPSQYVKNHVQNFNQCDEFYNTARPGTYCFLYTVTDWAPNLKPKP
jgi:hypothetical protein